MGSGKKSGKRRSDCCGDAGEAARATEDCETTYYLQKDLGQKNYERRGKDRAKKFQWKPEKRARGDSPEYRFAVKPHAAKYSVPTAPLQGESHLMQGLVPNSCELGALVDVEF